MEEPEEETIYTDGARAPKDTVKCDSVSKVKESVFSGTESDHFCLPIKACSCFLFMS